MTDIQLRAVIEQNIQRSQWFESTDYQTNMKDALNSYYGRDKPKATDGTSTARSQDVADMVEAVVASLMPAFDFDIVALFDANGPQDVEQARHESIVCNAYLRDRNMGYTTLQEAIRNALLLRNGILRIDTERSTSVDSRRYTGLTDLELLQVAEPTHPDQVVEVINPNIEAESDGISVTIKRTTNFRRLSIRSIDPINFLITREWDSIETQDAPMVGERFFLTRSDLIRRGHSKKRVFEIATTDVDTREATQARNREADLPRLYSNGDPASQAVECFEIWLYVDQDGDGVAERRRFLYAGGASSGIILENELAPVSPFACGTPFIQPQRWLGMSMFDKLREIEDQKTETLRAYLDNNRAANVSEMIAVDGDVNMQDLETRRPGGIIRADNIDSVREVRVSDNGPSSLALLEYLDKVRSERGGASLDLQAAELQLAGETAHGVERQFTSKEQLAQLITRTLAETLIRQTFLLIHETLRRDFPDRQQLQLGNEFVTATPGDWPARDRVRIVAGMSAGDRQARRQALEMVLGQQEKLIGAGFGGGILTNLSTYHDTLIDWLTAAGVPNARRYWIDPRTPESIEAQRQAAQAQAQAQAQQGALEQALFQTQLAIQEMQEQTKRGEHADRLRFDYWAETLKSELEEMKIDQQQDPDIESDQEHGRRNA